MHTVVLLDRRATSAFDNCRSSVGSGRKPISRSRKQSAQHLKTCCQIQAPFFIAEMPVRKQKAHCCKAHWKVIALWNHTATQQNWERGVKHFSGAKGACPAHSHFCWWPCCLCLHTLKINLDLLLHRADKKLSVHLCGPGRSTIIPSPAGKGKHMQGGTEPQTQTVCAVPN